MQALENSSPLDTGSVLCSECRRVIGLVEDIFGQVTQPSYAVRPCGDSLKEMPSVDTKVMAVSSHMVRVDIGTAQNAPAIDFEEGVEDPEDLDDDDLEDGVQKKAPERISGEVGGGAKSSKGKNKGKKPVGTFQGMAGVNNAEDALRAMGPTGNDRVVGPDRDRGRSGTGGRGRSGMGGRGRHGSGRKRQHKGTPEEAVTAGHGIRMQPSPVVYTASGSVPPPHGHVMPVMAGVQPGMPMMMMPHGYMPAGGSIGGGPGAVGMGVAAHPAVHMQPTGVGPRPPFVACPPGGVSGAVPVGPPGGLGQPPQIVESFEQKLARALGPPPL